eukprot:TRINITY_DN7389_c0_g1_i1.p1 TRINITY_DN7389_c0_g1~~TRINITY_DN7389_c0_g1_i1.p1  ORF type:complete len:617 (-),score=108.48 TRINITY_DN7389_c0_g1_i1:20-1870(-)
MDERCGGSVGGTDFSSAQSSTVFCRSTGDVEELPTQDRPTTNNSNNMQHKHQQHTTRESQPPTTHHTKQTPHSIQATVVETCEQILPEHANSNGWLLAGQLMAWIDICGGISAKRHAGSPCATVALEQLYFYEPIAVGEIATICTQVNRAFTTSMEIGAVVYAEHPSTGESRQCCSAILIFALTNKRHGPLSPIMPAGPQQEERYHQAELRRRIRTASAPMTSASSSNTTSSPSRAELPFSIFKTEKKDKKHWDEQKRATTTHSKSASNSGNSNSGGGTRHRNVGRGRSDNGSGTGNGSGAEGERQTNGTAHSTHQLLDVSDMDDYKDMSDTRVEMMELILPTHSNTIGIAFGGQLMRWMDIVASMSVARLSTKKLAYVSAINSLVLFTPVQIGEVVKLSAEVTCIFESSLEVAVVIEKENPYTCDTVWCGSAYFTFSLSQQQRLPRITATTAEEKLVQDEARYRHQQRLGSSQPPFKVPATKFAGPYDKDGYSHARKGLEHNYKILTLCFILPPLAVFLLLTSETRKKSVSPKRQAGPRSTSVLDAVNLLVCCLLTLLMWIPGVCYALMNYTFISLVEELKSFYHYHDTSVPNSNNNTAVAKDTISLTTATAQQQ